MNEYEIIQTKTGHSFGIYHAENGGLAIRAMLRDSGSDSDESPDSGIKAFPVSYRGVVGEKGNDIGHVVAMAATNEADARAALALAVAPYGSDGWGRIEYQTAGMQGWERL